MTFPYVQKLAGLNGHSATFAYGLAQERGWDVRAELDDRLVILRHCSDWPAVERLREWLRRQLQ
jgi:hypothetical protein